VGGDFQGRTVGASFQLAGFGSQVENLTYREGANAQTVTVTAAATIRANALQSGDGGRIVVWSDQRTEMDGTVSAQGGSAGGNGGFIEVSGKGNLNYGGSADAGARHGKTGTLLLDPKNIIISEAPAGVFPQFNFIDPHPTPGGRFGIAVSALSTGKVVVTSPFDNFGGTFAGAVYLFDGVSGALLSSLVGSNASDQVGSIDPSGTSGVFILDNSNTGVRGTISDANSLVGTNPSDNVGGDCFLDFTCITLLSNGNYVVRSPEWNGRRGAVTWGNGTTGVRGAVSAANSLIGSNSSERIGFYRVTVLNNGNYVVQSSDWNNRRGAVTWGNGQAGVSGTISEANSLVGTNADDQVGYNGVTALSNGNYVVRSIYWNDRHGAVTWGDGQRGVTGTVSDANSLTGSRYGDTVGDGIIPLTNGNYLVQSEDWNGNRGAVTWGDGTHAVAGPVDASNSLVGSNPGYTCIPSFNPGDCVGDGAITALSNGNYVVASPLWDGQRGAATWGSGTTGVSGIVSETNSLVGTNPFDQVGVYGAMPLNNGNYVVLSPFWNTRLGAATWGSGAAGVSGVVSADNSLVGSSVVGSVGSGFVTGLSNGNYLVMSPNGRGAVTWGNGTAGVSGLVSADNSLVGSNPNDFVGTDVTRLSNGNYVVSSPNWNGLRGAVTWGSGAAGVSGQVSADNSLVGSNPGDQVGDGPGGVTPFANGNYAVTSWALGGAVTWGSGSTGVNGAVSTANSLVGTGGSSVTRLSNSNYVVASPNWSANRGAVTWVSGTTGQTLNSNGFITPQNSLVGTAGNAGLGFVGENTTSQTFLAAFVIEGSGRLTSSFVDPNQLSYNRGQSQTVTITPGFLTNTLNTGTDVTLQASNDITIEDPIIVRAGGKGGALTLQAGRSIILNASISTDNGSLTLIANDTLANGVVDSQRDPGNAFITMAGRTQLNTGTGRLNIELRNGAGRTYTGSRSINLQTITAGSVKVVNNGPSTGSDVILGPVTSNGPQTYSSPNGTTFVSGNVTAADSPITFADSVVVDDRLRIDAGSNKIRFNSAGTQNLQTGSGDSFGNVDHNGTGTLQLAGPLNISGTFTNSAGTFDANDQPVTVSGLATLSAGTYRAGTAPQTLLGGLVIGAGTFTSSTGPMSVNGTVAITGGSLAGEGTVGPLTVVAGTLIPGAGGPGILTVGGSVALFFGSTFTVRLNGFEPGTSYSQLVAEGPIFLGGSTLNLVLGFEPPVGRSFEIVQGTAPDPISGTFAGLDEGAVFEQGGFQFQITYIGGNTANSVVLTRLA